MAGLLTKVTGAPSIVAAALGTWQAWSPADEAHVTSALCTRSTSVI